MSFHVRTVHRVAVVGCVALIAAVSSATAAPLVIKPGQDGFVTEPGSTATLPDLPAGFFGMKAGTPSDPIASFVLPVVSGPNLVAIPVIVNFLVGDGCHTGMVNHHCYMQQRVELTPIYDTVVERTGGTLSGVGDTETLAIKLVHLSLKSAQPFEVKYGLEPSSFFDIFISLDPGQSPGTLDLELTGNRTGLMDTVLPVKYSVTFKGVAPGDNGPFIVAGLEDVLRSQDNPFGVPEPGMLLLLSTGLAGLMVRRRAKSK